MSNSHKLVKEQHTKPVSDFLTEQDIRKVVRKRLQEERIMRIGLIGEIALINNQYEKNHGILTEGVFDDVITAIKAELSGSRATDYNTALKIAAGVSTAILTGFSVTSVWGLPWFIPVKAKLLLSAAIIGTGAFAFNLMVPFINSITTDASFDLIFLKTNDNPVNKILLKLRQGIIDGQSSGDMKMPEIPGGISYNPTDTPADCNTQLQAYLDSTSSIIDFLGVPIADFTGPGGASPAPLNLDADGFGYRANSGKVNTAAQNMVNIIKTATSNIIEAVLDVVADFIDDPDVSLYDLQFLDHRFGKLLSTEISNGGIVCGSATMTLDTPGPGSGVHFIETESAITGNISDLTKSNIMNLLQHINVFLNRVGGGIPTPLRLMMSGITPKPWTDGEVSDYLVNTRSIDLASLNDQKMFMINKDLTSPSSPLTPYLINKPLTDIFPGHGKLHSNGTSTLVGKGFFEELGLGLKERAIAFLTELFDYCWNKITAAAGWVGQKLTDLYNWYDTNVSLSGIIAAISAGAAAIWAWISDLFTSFLSFISGLIGGGGSGGSSRSASRGRQSYRSEVEEMQKVMNKINDERGLTGSQIKADGYWGARTDSMWTIVTNYGFDIGVLKDDPDSDTYDAGFHKWPGMSGKLRDNQGTNYPGYTPDPQGALNIVNDVYNNNNELGLGTGGATPGETNLSASGPEPEETLTTPKPTRGSVGVRGIKIRIDAGNNDLKTFEALGFPDGTTRNVSEDILSAIRSENYTGTGEEGIQLKIKVSRRNRVFGVKPVRRGMTTSRLTEILPFFNSLERKIKDTLRSTGPVTNLRDTITSFNGKAFTMSITIPPGAKRQR